MEIIAEKIGMSKTLGVPSFAVTLLKVKDMKVCEATEQKALVAYNSKKKFNSAIEGQQKKYNLSREFNRFVTLDIKDAQAGDIDLSPLNDAKRVKVTLKTKGRGFSGVVKKYGFGGGPKSHGSRFGRAPGSIGNAEFPGRVQRGQKMPGQYGNSNVTVKNSVVSFDNESKILVLRGSIPGANGTLARVKVI
jgi:large subunit ribosomal protein L3